MSLHICLLNFSYSLLFRFVKANSNDQVDSRVNEPEPAHNYHECLSETFLNECRGNLSNDMPNGRNVESSKARDSPRTPTCRSDQTPTNKNMPIQVTQSAAPLTRFEKLSQFVSRSALKVVNNVAGSSSKSRSNLFANQVNSNQKTPGSNGSSPSTSMRSDDEDDEFNSNIQEEDNACQRTPQAMANQGESNQENNYFQYDQAK